MLTIKNIKELELNFCHQRGLREITETQNKLSEQFYSFHFGPISDGKGWNKETEVRLGRDINQEHYQIFVMGLQMATRIKVKEGRIKDKQTLILDISHVLSKAKDWWERSKRN